MRRASDLGPPGRSDASAPCTVIHSSTSARALARRDGGFGGAQMAQPAEAEQAVRPFLRRRRDLERRAAVADHDLAGEGEAAGIDFARAGARRRCAGPAARSAAGRPCAGMSASAAADGREPPGDAARSAPRASEHGQLGALRNRHARHRRARLSVRPRASHVPPASPIAKAPADGQHRRNRRQDVIRFSQPRGVEAVEPAHARVGIGQMARQGAQIARRR